MKNIIEKGLMGKRHILTMFLSVFLVSCMTINKPEVIKDGIEFNIYGDALYYFINDSQSVREAVKSVIKEEFGIDSEMMIVTRLDKSTMYDFDIGEIDYIITVKLITVMNVKVRISARKNFLVQDKGLEVSLLEKIIEKLKRVK